MNSEGSGQNFCRKHQQNMIVQREKIKKWKLCKTGVYRNVWEYKKTWICPGNLSNKITKPLKLPSGEDASGISIPARLFTIFEKRKRT